jgi:hypothetical protein
MLNFWMVGYSEVIRARALFANRVECYYEIHGPQVCYILIIPPIVLWHLKESKCGELAQGFRGRSAQGFRA